MKSPIISRPGKFRPAFVVAIGALLALGSPLSAATYSYDGGAPFFPGTLWSDGGNWVGDTVPTFNNQADLVFDTNISAAAMRTGAARTVRSMTFGDNLTGNPSFDFIRLDTVLDNNTGTPALTLQADSGNATVTLASGFQLDYIQLGRNTGGNVILGSSLDLHVNAANKDVRFDSVVSGSGALNKYGVGDALLYQANTFSGGVNIFAGTIEAYNSGSALGTGAVALGGTDSSTNATLRVGNAITITNAMTVNSGSGTRTISNDSARAGNATLSGGFTLNTNATFNITSVTASSHDRMTLSGAVGGTGGLVKTGTGILILSASNNYSGTTDIQGGKLYLGGAGRLGTGDVTIASGADLDFGTGAGQINIVANDISGDGSILQNVASTDTRFTGDVTSTGGMTINAGTVRIGNGGTTGSYNGDATVNTGAVLAFARNDAYTHGGTITGAGGVTKTSSGEVTLTGNNSYSGPTTLFTSVLVADNANALGTGDIIFRPEGDNNGTIRYTAASAGTDWASRIKGSTGTIRLDTGTNIVTLAGVIDSSNTNGLTKSGAGTLTLGGANTYGGATTVSAGSLIINGDQSSATGVLSVSSGATLGGSGTIGGATTISGTLSPGNSTGTLTFNDNLTLDLNSTSAFEINGFGDGQFDLVQGLGNGQTVTFAGTLNLTFLNNFSTEGSVQIFDFENYSGGFNSFNTTGLAEGYSATFDSLSGTVNVVPEPSTYALLALAAAGLGAHVVRRRRHNR